MKRALIGLLAVCFINSFSGGAFCMDKNTVVFETNQGNIEIRLLPENNITGTLLLSMHALFESIFDSFFARMLSKTSFPIIYNNCFDR